MWSPVEVGGDGGGGGTPCGRGKHSATLLGGRVYVLGGRGAGGSLPLKDFWMYSLAQGTWERLPCRGEPPPALQEHTAVARGTCLYVFGGEAGTLSTETPLWLYDTQTSIWRKLSGSGGGTSTGVKARAGANGVRGRTTTGADGARGRTATGADGPRGRRGHSAHGLSDCMLLYGGYKDLRGSTNELWAFHYETESWHLVRTATPGPPRHRHAAVLHSTRLYVHAGMHDLRHCADLWHYDTMSRTWTCVRSPPRVSPGARSGHAAVLAGAHMYIFGGDVDGHATNELWRFHFECETWERVEAGMSWPAARVDACALLVPVLPSRGGVLAPPTPPAPAPAPPPAPALMSRLQWSVKRASRCSYTVLEQDSADTLHTATTTTSAASATSRSSSGIAKSHSAYVMDKRQVGFLEPLEADEAEFRCEVSREPVSVPDFSDMVPPTPVGCAVPRGYGGGAHYTDSDSDSEAVRRVRVRPRPRSGDDASTSDYASAERVGFCNPHYLGGDVRGLCAALTPDSGLGAPVSAGAPGDVELQDLSVRPRRATPPRRRLLLVGGKETPHAALLQRPLAMWTYSDTLL